MHPENFKYLDSAVNTRNSPSLYLDALKATLPDNIQSITIMNDTIVQTAHIVGITGAAFLSGE